MVYWCPRSSPAPPASTNSGSLWREADVIHEEPDSLSADASVSAFLHAAATCVNVAAFKTRQFLSAPLEGGSAPLLLPSFTVTCFFFFFCIPLIPDSVYRSETLDTTDLFTCVCSQGFFKHLTERKSHRRSCPPASPSLFSTRDP